MPLTIRRLTSGGIMTNYKCTSRCAHCLYRSSPQWPDDYIGGEILDGVCESILSLSCRSIHKV